MNQRRERSRCWTKRRWRSALRGARMTRSTLNRLPDLQGPAPDRLSPGVFDPLIVLADLLALLFSRNRHYRGPPWRYVPEDPP